MPRGHLAAIDLASGLPTHWNPDLNGPVTAIATRGAVVYAGGCFTSLHDMPRRHLAAIDARSGVPTQWDPDADGAVTALSVTEGGVLAGGSFTRVHDMPRMHLVALDPGSGVPEFWDPEPVTPALLAVHVEPRPIPAFTLVTWLVRAGSMDMLSGGYMRQ
jgi:hypothetical protein